MRGTFGVPMWWARVSELTATSRWRNRLDIAHGSMTSAIAEGRSVRASTATVDAARVRTRGRPSSASRRSHWISAGRAEGVARPHLPQQHQ